jgi:L-threonylcarbamoyladenylate synthase
LLRRCWRFGHCSLSDAVVVKTDPQPIISAAELQQAVEQAVRRLQQGGLVAIPTETVYGLAADASNEQAVEKIFSAKGRPANHPLIVHLAAPSMMEASSANQSDAWFKLIAPWVRDLPEEAMRLVEAFWPGPLTLVLKKDKHVLSAVTGGQDTIALRSPDHPVAQALLQAFGGGLAAPSANRFGKVSPTRAADVSAEFSDQADLLILDGGDCAVGIESTIVDMSSGVPVLLRPGAITPEQIAQQTGVRVLQAGALVDSDQITPRVSGSLKAHYAPNTPLRLYAAGAALDCISQYPDTKSHVALIVWESEQMRDPQVLGASHILQVPIPEQSDLFASRLYRLLRDLDDHSWDLIVMPEPPIGQEWDGVRDRLQRACFGSGPPVNNHVSS